MSVNFSKELLEANASNALECATKTDNAIALVDAWVSAANAEAVQELAERAAGKLRTAARRGLNVLKSRGVPIPPRRKHLASNVAPVKELEAVMMPPDGSGTCLFVISHPHPSGRCDACFAYLNDSAGVQRIERVESTSNKIKSVLQKNYATMGAKPVSVPLPWARYRIAEARKIHAAAKVPEPLGFDSSKDLLEPLPDAPPEHPFDTEGFEFALDDAKDLASDSGALHHLPEFAGWLPSQSAVNELFREVGKRISDETVEDKGPEQERVSELLKLCMLESTDRYFTEARRDIVVARMKDAALSVLSTRGEADTLKVAATIQVIGQCGLVTDPPRDVPFLRAFFEKAVSLSMMQQGGALKIPVPKRSTPVEPVAEAAG